jgi:hypothetical protein
MRYSSDALIITKTGKIVSVANCYGLFDACPYADCRHLKIIGLSLYIVYIVRKFGYNFLKKNLFLTVFGYLVKTGLIIIVDEF